MVQGSSPFRLRKCSKCLFELGFFYADTIIIIIIKMKVYFSKFIKLHVSLLCCEINNLFSECETEIQIKLQVKFVLLWSIKIEINFSVNRENNAVFQLGLRVHLSDPNQAVRRPGLCYSLLYIVSMKHVILCFILSAWSTCPQPSQPQAFVSHMGHPY